MLHEHDAVLSLQMVFTLDNVVQPTQYPQEIEDGVNPRAGDFKALLAVGKRRE